MRLLPQDAIALHTKLKDSMLERKSSATTTNLWVRHRDKEQLGAQAAAGANCTLAKAKSLRCLSWMEHQELLMLFAWLCMGLGVRLGPGFVARLIAIGVLKHQTACSNGKTSAFDLYNSQPWPHSRNSLLLRTCVHHSSCTST